MQNHDDLSIDLERYEELSPSFIKKLSGEKVLSVDILNQSGQVLFKSGQPISSDELEERITEGSRFYIPRPTTREGTYEHEIIPKQKLQELAEDTARLYSDVRKKGVMSHDQYINSHRQLADILKGFKKEDRFGGILGLLKEIQDFDYYTYVHSVNVSMLAMTYEYKVSYKMESIRNMAMAGYLHDIGKLRIPSEVLDKPGPLTRKEHTMMLEHTREGYRILDAVDKSAGVKLVNDSIKHGALFHHRKYRISGYPNRKSRDKRSEQFYSQLPVDVRMLGLFDIYDAVTTATPYRKACAPDEALRYILNISNYYFHISDINLFLKTMALSLNRGQHFIREGDFVVLEAENTFLDGQSKVSYEFARVEENFRGKPVNPRVAIFFNMSKNKKVHPITVDLRYDHHRSIVRIINDERMKKLVRSLYISQQGNG